MSYVQDNLLPNEKVLFSAYVSWAIFIPAGIAFLGGIGFFLYYLNIAAQKTNNSWSGAVFLFFIALLFFAWGFILEIKAIIIKTTTEFAVTNKRVIAKTGFIRRRTIEMLLSKVESVSVNQNVLGRICNFGTVIITGTGGTREPFRVIVDPLDVRKKVNTIIEKYMQAYAEYQQQRMTASGSK